MIATHSVATGERSGFRDRQTLSAAARAAVRRRRLLAGVAAALAVVALLVVVGVFAFGEDPPAPPAQSAGRGAGAPPPGRPPQAGAPRVLGQVPLRANPGEQGEGQAVIAEQDGQRVLVVQAQGLKPLKRDQLLEVWFYNSKTDAKSLGAQRVANGRFQGLGALPRDFARYRFVDLSREQADRRPAHSGDSVLRGALADATPGSGQGGAAPAPGR